MIHRSTRSFGLTPAGETFAERCRRMVEEASAGLMGLEVARSEPRGHVRITCSNHFGNERVVPELVDFRRLYPEIALDVVVTDETLDLVAGGVDLAVRAGPLSDSNLKARLLLEVNTMLCAAPDYLAKHGAPESVEDLSQHTWVVYPPSQRILRLVDDDEEQQVSLHGRIQTNSGASRLAFVLAGEGIARLPEYSAKPRLAAGHLERVLPWAKIEPLKIYLVRSEQAGPSARLLADFLVRKMAGTTRV